MSDDGRTVLLEMADGIARIRLNRPDAANGMNIELLRALNDALMTCHGAKDLRVVLITGQGANFCAGGDVRDFASKGEDLPDYLRMATTYLQSAVGLMLHMEAPVIVAVQGYAAGGGGFGLVCAADFVIAADTAKFLAGATRVGMAPDAGTSATLPRLVGMRQAMRILLTNPVIDAAEALRLGIVTELAPAAELDATALALARTLADGAPRALAATKRLLLTGAGTSIEAALPEEARTVSELSGSVDAREGLAAVIERRKPRFIGR